MFGISGEHLLVLLVILLIFGPKRLPDLGHSIGRTLKNFKDAMGGQMDAPVAPASQIQNRPVAQAPVQAEKPVAAAAPVQTAEKVETQV